MDYWPFAYYPYPPVWLPPAPFYLPPPPPPALLDYLLALSIYPEVYRLYIRLYREYIQAIREAFEGETGGHAGCSSAPHARREGREGRREAGGE